MTTDCNCIKRPHVHCKEKTNCRDCGWNPEVEKIRKARMASGLPALPRKTKGV